MTMADAGYSGTPLVKKLGIKEGTTLALVGAPDGFQKLLRGLPADVKIVSGSQGAVDLIIWWPASVKDLHARVRKIEQRIAPGGGLWGAWAKKASGVKTDLTENSFRDACLPIGLVDYKVCAISDIWSGLKFARRKT
jgi:hypothetical protein